MVADSPIVGPKGSVIKHDPIPLSKQLSELEAAHSIEVLLFILEYEGCTKTTVYDSLSRSTAIQSKIAMLVSAGLLVVSTVEGTRISSLHLTDTGRDLAEFLRAFNERMLPIVQTDLPEVFRPISFPLEA